MFSKQVASSNESADSAVFTLTTARYRPAVQNKDRPPDGRMLNKGSAKRRRYTMKEKYDIVEMCNDAIASDDIPTITTATQYFHYYYANHDIAHKWICQYGKWNKKEHRVRMVDEILGKNFASKARHTRSPFHHMESLLYSEILSKRKLGHRVSNTFIRIRSICIFNRLQEEGVPVYKDASFKSSNGWRTNFIRRRNLKYRRRKSGKTFSADRHLPQYLDFLQRLRFKIIVALQDNPCESIRGQFPPSHRYNMDQVPLPFVVSQEFTFTVQEDVNIHITCPNEALRKRQWTMHVVANAGDGDSRHCWVDLVSKGLGKRIREEETARYHPTVDMFWQKNAWVDGPTIIKLAEKIVREKIERHGDDWVLLYCDNLAAHLGPDVKRILGDNRFLIFYPPLND